jgi:hypothetical protein
LEHIRKMPTIKPHAANAGLVALCLTLAGVAVALHSPGHMTTDTSIQLHEAFSGRIESWAPPFMSALLYWLGLGTVGTSLFVLLNVALTYAGLYLSARSQASSTPWPLWRFAIALPLIANPVIFAYVGIVWKDVLLASLCVASLGCSIHAARLESPRLAIAFAALALLLLLPIPMVRQQGILLLPVFALSPALSIAKRASPSRRKYVLAAVYVLLALGYVGLKGIVASSFDKGPDGRDFSVGTQIIKRYDLAGIQYRTGSEGPLARAGAPQAALDAIQATYGGDRVDRLGASPALGAFLDARTPDQIDAMWRDAMREHPRAYLAHRFSAYAWLLGFHEAQACLPFHVGVEGIDVFLQESGIREEQERRDQRMFDWNRMLVDSPLWKHWSYAGLLVLLAAAIWFRRREQRGALLPWAVGLGMFAGSFLPTSIACDFRYLYLLVPCTAALALALLSPARSPVVD